MLFLSDITRYSYSPKELRRCIRIEDFWRYKITGGLDKKTEEVSKGFYNSNFGISGLGHTKIGSRDVFSPRTLYDALCLRRTNEILQRALRATASNRDDEVRQIMQILANLKASMVFKADVYHLFESIPFDKVIEKLESEGLRHNTTLKHLRALNAYLIGSCGYKGLPAGLGLSSTLADYAFQQFDYSILNHGAVEYYTRYVDDIVILHCNKPVSMEGFVKQMLPCSLTLNSRKTKHYTYPSDDNLEYLGYSIPLHIPQVVKVAPSKIDKTKKRLVLSLKAYLSDRDFNLLLSRIRFLSSGIRMRRADRESSIFCGYKYVYRLCDRDALLKQMRELDTFFLRLITSRRYSLTKRLLSRLSQDELDELRKISFKASIKNGISIKMKRNLIAEIKRAWKYE